MADPKDKNLDHPQPPKAAGAPPAPSGYAPRRAFLGAAQTKPAARPKLDQRRPVDDEDYSRKQRKADTTAKLSTILIAGRPAIFTREKPGHPGARQFMALIAGTVYPDGRWEGFTVHPDTGVSKTASNINQMGKWDFRGFLLIADEHGNPVDITLDKLAVDPRPSDED